MFIAKHASFVAMPNLIRLSSLAPVVVFFLFFLGTIGLAGVSAQAQRDEGTVPQETLRPGAWALQFAVGENFTLESFSGSTLSLKWHFSRPSAVQAGLTFETNSLNREQTIEDETRITDSGTQRITLSAEYINYPLLGEWATVIEPFFGAGPSFSYIHSDSETTQNDSLLVRQESNGWAAGLSATLGVEWFVHSRIGIHAAYRAAGVYRRDTSMLQQGEGEEEGPTEERFAIQAGGVRFGLSVYF